MIDVQYRLASVVIPDIALLHSLDERHTDKSRADKHSVANSQSCRIPSKQRSEHHTQRIPVLDKIVHIGAQQEQEHANPEERIEPSKRIGPRRFKG